MANDTNLNSLIDALYTMFQGYGAGGDFCTFCYSEEEIQTITNTPVRDISKELGGKLLRETGNHWPSSEVYRHYLPRILEVMGPPNYEEDLYPEHLFETLKYHQFSQWPDHERRLVKDFLVTITPLLTFDKDAFDEWARGMKSVETPNKRLKHDAQKNRARLSRTVRSRHQA
jgi:hypothetical protein